MTIEEFLDGFEHGKIGLSFNGMDEFLEKFQGGQVIVDCASLKNNPEDAERLVKIIRAMELQTWNGMNLEEYISSRFCTGQYRYLKRSSNSYRGISGMKGADGRPVLLLDGVLELLDPLEETVSNEDFNSILN